MENNQIPKVSIVVSSTGKVPKRQTPGSAGYDLHADENVVIPPHGKATIKTGLKLALPEGYYGRIAPRSSLAHKNHIDVGAGILDSDFRDFVCVILFNLSPTESFTVNVGDRIAQLIIEKYHVVEFEVVEKLDTTARIGGFGSTGK